ncbi:oxygenase [Aggregatibacter actinomycetemcomitans]|nr:oxygenase [Aggregatibacter actinomycetemcomitans]MBN6067536.1 oxygenase [Aggregatibacter actinomycetemcomitans]MBN6086532.1 oxygenase [Aggregatibacter actinomycetemcomitans]
MTHKIVRSADFTAARARGGLDIIEMNGISVRLR